MITTTKANKQAYAALFNDASKVLEIEDSPITNLTQYFENIGTLSNIAIAEGLNGHTDYYKFIRLPIELNDDKASSEPIFTIDANSRQIIIPDIFKKGISVEGDHGAEVIYFVIDRYFDAQDLYGTVEAPTNIIIQWETAPTNDKKAQTEKGASRAFLVDKDSYPTKLVFGWILDNRITKHAGSIKFSVRIYQVGEDVNGDPVITYSFSTTTATATINPSLNYDLVDDVAPEANESLVLLRLKNSPRSEQGDAASPVFIVDLNEVGDVTPVYEEGHEGEEDHILYYDFDLVDQDNLTQVLLVQANTGDSEDTYNMQYSWEQKNADGETLSKFGYTDAYIAIASGAFDPNTIYYKAERDAETDDILGYSPITDATGNIEDYTEDDQPVTVYQKFSKMTLNRAVAPVTGYYRAKAINLMGAANASETDGVTLHIPGPTTLTLDIDDQQAIIFERDEEEGVRVGDGLIDLEAETATNDGLVTHYEWYRTDADGVIVETLDNDAATLSLECDEDYLPLYDKYYKVKVITSRNGDSIDTTSPLYRVTDAPHPVIILDEHDRLWQREKHPRIEATATNLNDIVHDEVLYTWYFFNVNDPDEELEIPDIDTDEALKDACVKEASTEPFFNLTKSDGEKVEGGQYYCKVTNTVNGQSVNSYSKRYLVV